MNEFSQRYSDLSRDQRVKVRRDMEKQAVDSIGKLFRLRATSKQLKAAAKKKVDIAISRARKAA